MMTSLTELQKSAEDARVVAERALEVELTSPPVVELGNESFSSTSSASSPQSSRSGTSSRSLRGLSKTWLVECLPALLFAVAAQIQLSLAQGSVAGERSGKTT